MIFLPAKLRWIALAVLLTLMLPACKHSGGRVLEIAYVSGVQVNLRDRVAAFYGKAGVVKNGDRVEVLDHEKHFVKVRTATGQMGWIEQRYLVSQKVFDRLQRLTTENAKDPVQARGVTRNDTNLHVEPGRDTEHLYQISAGEKLELLKRGMAEKSAGATPARTWVSAEKAGEKKTSDRAGEKKQAAAGAPQPVTPQPPASQPAISHPPGPHSPIEDWWLVRDSQGRIGWVLGRMVDLDVPLEVAQYAEGQRIVAFFVLNEVRDGDKKVAQYLTVLTEPKDGLPFDFNQFRVFTWNVRRHRYETAYRERIEGVLPVTMAQENFGKEGVLPAFVVRALDQDGKVRERKYKLNTPIVRRVIAAGEEPVHKAARKVRRQR